MTASLAVRDPVLADFAAEVGEEGPVAVRGGGTRWAAGGGPDPGTREVRAPSGIVAFTPEEMTVTVRAGTSVAELHEVLAAAGQRTALPERPGGTVGGALAVGESTVHRLGRGHLRDALLQVRYASADGRMVTGGGPTVKNVTGFDLCRVMVGALGTLGLLAEVILRTRPVPPAAGWWVGESDPFAVFDALYRPSALLWDGRRLWVHLEGHAVDVEHELATLAALGSFTAVGAGPDLPPERGALAPAALRELTEAATGGFVAEIGVGVVHSHRAVSRAKPAAEAVEIGRRLKAGFDPTARLNPGRDPIRR